MDKQESSAPNTIDKKIKKSFLEKTKKFSFLKNSFHHLLFAEDFECLHCGAERLTNDYFYLCKKCFDSLNFIENACDICGDKVSSFDIICNRCKEVSHHFTKAFCVTKYEGTALHLVQKLKYGGCKYLSTALGQLMAEKLKSTISVPYQNALKNANEHPTKNVKSTLNNVGEKQTKTALSLTDIDWVVPVALNKKRMKKRGYNQALLLGKVVAAECNLPFAPYLIKRIKDTPTQTSLPIKQRHENVKNAFEITNPSTVKGATILLIDDIITTGATADEIAKCLLKCKAKAVFVLAFCHA